MRTYDCFTFFNELDLLEIRLNELSSVVDTFVIAESPLTFQGNPKPLYFQENRARFAKFDKQIRHIVVSDMPATENPWDRERHQRNALKRGMSDAAPDAMVLISDADEIPTSAAILELKNRKDLTYLQMKLFVYFLNYQVLEGVDAPTIASYGAPWQQIQELSDLTAPRDGSPDNYLNSRNMSALSEHIVDEGGWHFSWLGSPEHILQKMDAFSHTEKRYRQWHNPQDLARIIAEKRFFVTNSSISIRPAEEMPVTVQNAYEHYRRKGMLISDSEVVERRPESSSQDTRQVEPLPPRVSKKGLTELQCPVCGSKSLESSATKFEVDYFSCKNCNAVFSGDLDPGVIQTHNEDPEGRANISLQKVRLQRVMQQLGRRPDKILDFGCGRGDYVDFLNGLGFQAVGVDQDTDLKLSDLPPQSFDAINMVEIIEHLGNPDEILENLIRVLKPGGVIYVESSFVDFIGNPARSDYVDPRIGHCCIHSRKSIDYLCKKLGLRQTWLNNNVIVMHKGIDRVRLTPLWN